MKKDLTLVERLNAPTAAFFVPILKISGLISAVCFTLIAILPQVSIDLNNVGLTFDLNATLKYLALINSIAALISKLTVNWDEYAKQQGYREVYFPRAK